MKKNVTQGLAKIKLNGNKIIPNKPATPGTVTTKKNATPGVKNDSKCHAWQSQNTIEWE